MSNIDEYLTQNHPNCISLMGKEDRGWDVDNYSLYKTLTSGGVKEEGVPYPSHAFFSTEENAWEGYLLELDKLLSRYKDGAVIYWREKPNEIKPHCKWAIRSRLDIVAKPSDYVLGDNGGGWVG